MDGHATWSLKVWGWSCQAPLAKVSHLIKPSTLQLTKEEQTAAALVGFTSLPGKYCVLHKFYCFISIRWSNTNKAALIIILKEAGKKNKELSELDGVEKSRLQLWYIYYCPENNGKLPVLNKYLSECCGYSGTWCWMPITFTALTEVFLGGGGEMATEDSP